MISGCSGSSSMPGSRVAANTRPAPPCRAARAASTAAPSMPRAPPSTTRSPKLPLCVLRRRGASRSANSAGPFSTACAASWCKPSAPSMSTRTAPAWSQPSPVCRPGLLPRKVMVCVAVTAAPCGPTMVPVSASRPLGTSIASTGQSSDAVHTASSRACPVKARARPMPNSASTTRRQGRPGGIASTKRTCASPARCRARPVSNEGVALPARCSTSTSKPSRARCAATSRPSPPLLPGPARTSTAPPGSPASSSRAYAAAASPARSISVPGARWAWAACSMARIWSQV